MDTKAKIIRDWLPRYTGTELHEFGDYCLLTNFSQYIDEFSQKFGVEIKGRGMPMQTASHGNLSIINFGIGSANAATIMDLLGAIKPKGVLFLGKCGGIKRSSEIGHFILPTAAIRGEGTSLDYFPPEIPALPSFKLHKFVSEKIVEAKLEYRTGVIYTTNRRVWEHDLTFKKRLKKLRALAVDMETATIFMVGLANDIARGALLLVSDLPMTPEGVKTRAKDKRIAKKYTKAHLQLGIEAMTDLGDKGEKIKHFKF